MAKASKPRNNLVELGRFVYSLLVLGYHVQFSYSDDEVDFFENGALAVEFYFLLSGYFLARSLEKLVKDDKTTFFKKVYFFMKNKITALLNVHFLSIIVVIIIILCFDISSFWDKFLNGIPSIFFVQMAIVWSGDFNKALIVPEWYLSAMLFCMLFMVIIFLLLGQSVKGIYSTIILVGILILITVIVGLITSWKFNENIVYDIRAWGEMSIGMFSYYLSIYIKNKTFGNIFNLILKIVEMIGYSLPVIFGSIPVSTNYQVYLMMVTVICEFLAVTITFSEKGNIIKNQNLNKAFGYLGAISLPIYLFHPVIITLIDYINKSIPKWVKYLIVFPSTLILSFLYRIIADCLNEKMKQKENENQKENEKDKEKEKEKEKEKDNEIKKDDNIEEEKEKEVNEKDLESGLINK
jgi:peptidoglycan/LPS O-acetylase OafA/YrhL